MDNGAVRAASARKVGSPYLTTKQAAFYLNMSARTLQRHRLSGVGPAFRRHRGLVHYHIDDLEGWSDGPGSASHA